MQRHMRTVKSAAGKSSVSRAKIRSAVKFATSKRGALFKSKSRLRDSLLESGIYASIKKRSSIKKTLICIPTCQGKSPHSSYRSTCECKTTG